MKYLSIASFLLLSFFAVGQKSPVGIFENHQDVGNPKNKGTAQYDDASQTYSLKGSGYNIWFNRDEFHYAYKKIGGDFILTANFELIGNEKGAAHRKIGWMIRESTNEGAVSVNTCSHGDGLTVLQWRPLTGAFMRDPEDEIFFPKKYFEVIQLERKGKEVTMRGAHPGEPLQDIGSHVLPDMRDSLLVGIYILAHDPEAFQEGKVWNVRIDKPVADNYDPYKKGFLGCRLEILTVADGTRKVIRESNGRFEAPNWMPDGKKLLFNEDGSLYTIPVEGGTPEKLNTGTVTRNNNDHGISFDGKMLAISSSREGMPGGGSTVYTVPLTGGTPKMITDKTPSYFHGWAPSGKEVAFVGQRNGKTYDIYKIAVAGGEEVKLTSNTNYHVDGPEYSPDGKFIYYNGSASGTMQLWRMKPDGSAQEQLTFDQYNNWFPHISPDGKWIAFISFPPEVDPKDHPSYKRVMLRLMPVSGGAPKVIAYLYGGQGTINVPSWSPDSKRIAFVSNSGLK